MSFNLKAFLLLIVICIAGTSVTAKQNTVKILSEKKEFSPTSFYLSKKNPIEAVKPQQDETLYMWIYLPGSPCMHLMSIQVSNFLDYDGRSITTLTYTLMGSNNYIGTTIICPNHYDEWFV